MTQINPTEFLTESLRLVMRAAQKSADPEAKRLLQRASVALLVFEASQTSLLDSLESGSGAE